MRERHPRRTARASLVVALGLTLSVSLVGPALADRDERPVVPSKREIRAAEDEAASRAADVGAIKAELLMANQRLEAAATEAEQAAEAYNGARWRLEQAQVEVDRARREADRAQAAVAEQRDAIAALVVGSYQRGSDLTALNAMVGSDGPGGVLDQYSVLQGASTSLQADYDRFAATDALAKVFARKAAQAEQRQARVAAEAEAARAVATAAASAAQSAATEIAAQKDELIRALAQAQQISVDLARQRQSALEEIARQRAAEQARREAAAQVRAEAAAQAEADAAARRAAAREQRRDKAPDRPGNPGPAPQPAPSPAPSPAPAPAPPSPSGGAQAAIAFAKAQLGEPYQWGATGPGSWDCSGLTMGAWQAGGISLPHYSVAQYDAGTPISSGQLRAGDLVFWSSSSSPSGIHHVALYLGGGMIIHAPRTGRPVAIESMYYWIPPTHFARP